MGAIMNGLDAYGFHIPTAGTFLNFVSYAIGAVRLSALSHHRVIWVATHDSIGLGEDGPTHQPVETAIALRAIPNLMFWRPADGNEVSAAYKVGIESQHTPSVIALSRQNLPQLQGSSIEKAAKGGYVLVEEKDADITLVSTGSEVAISLDACKELGKKGIKARLVSIPCFEVFDKQDKSYRMEVLPSGHPIMSVEAYSTLGWSKYAHIHHGMDTFGASAPAPKLYAVSTSNSPSFKRNRVPSCSPLHLLTPPLPFLLSPTEIQNGGCSNRREVREGHRLLQEEPNSSRFSNRVDC